MIVTFVVNSNSNLNTILLSFGYYNFSRKQNILKNF